MNQIWTRLSRFAGSPPSPSTLPNLLRSGPRPGDVWRTFISGLDPLRPTASPVAAPFLPIVVQPKKFYPLFFVIACLIIIITGVDSHRPAPVAQAGSLQQAGDPTLQITGPALVNVGETFEIQVLVNNPLPTGIFGYQFSLTWNSTAFAPAEASPALSPEFPLITQTDISAGQLNVAASRQSDAPDLMGTLTLLTWRFQAIAAPSPDAVHFEVMGVSLGDKEGLSLPLGEITPLAVTVIEPAPQRGSFTGQIQLEGRVPGNQAGVTILVNELGVATTTTPNGDFTLADLDLGAYSLTASSPGFLSVTCTGAALNGEATPVTGVTLLAGDLNNDGVIDVADAAQIGLAVDGNNSGAEADLNLDGAANVLDLILLATNFGQSTAAHPWLCQP
jgi:hypothetical protein